MCVFFMGNWKYNVSLQTLFSCKQVSFLFFFCWEKIDFREHSSHRPTERCWCTERDETASQALLRTTPPKPEFEYSFLLDFVPLIILVYAFTDFWYLIWELWYLRLNFDAWVNTFWEKEKELHLPLKQRERILFHFKVIVYLFLAIW